jgi:hypothetical protein
MTLELKADRRDMYSGEHKHTNQEGCYSHERPTSWTTRKIVGIGNRPATQSNAFTPLGSSGTRLVSVTSVPRVSPLTPTTAAFGAPPHRQTLLESKRASAARSPGERARIRQAENRPLVDAVKTWLEGALGRISVKSVLAEVTRDPLRHWKELGLFLEDGLVEIDSNTIERTIRPIKLGADNGAESWAIRASLFRTVKLNDVEPFVYLSDVLERIALSKTKANELGSLLPWVWKASKV